MNESTDGFDYRSLLPTVNTNSNESESSDSPCFQLTFKERVLGCATCMVAGYLLSLGSFWRLTGLLTGTPLPFVMNATLGNIIALSGSCFLSGPSAQVQKMWHSSRRTATTLYIGSLVLTLLVAILWKLPGQSFLLIMLLLCQYVSTAWYCLSYIPFAQDAVMSCIRRYTASNEY